MARLHLPYLELFQARHQVAAYYRRDGQRRRLRGADGKPVDPADQLALTTAWQAAHDAHEAADRAADAAGNARIVRDRSIAELILKYRASPEWAEKKPETRRDYEKALKPLEADWGKLPVAGLQRRHVTVIRDKYAWREIPDPAKPGAKIRVANARQANRVVTVLSILLTYSIDPLGWRQDNPALRPKRLKKATEGYVAWTAEQFTRFCERSTEEWRFAAMLALLTAQRGQDQVAMAWSDYQAGRIHVVQEKGGRSVKLWVPCHPALKPLLDARKRQAAKLSPSPLTILWRGPAQPWPVNAFQKAAGAAIKAAGLEGVVWHGLRATAMSWAAEGGSSTKEMMALSGHKTSNMAEHYARGADQERLAGAAIGSIVLPKMKKSP